MGIFNFQFSIFNKRTGFSLVEALFVISIAIFSILMIWKVYVFYVKISLSNPKSFQASFLAEEGIEAVKFMRDSSWSGFLATTTPGLSYTLVWTGEDWRATTTPAMILGQFDRRVVFAGVYRDASGNISEAGTLDPDTRKVTVTVSWIKDTATTTRQITTYVTNLFKN